MDIIESRRQFEDLLREYQNVREILHENQRKYEVLNRLLRGYVQLFPEFEALMSAPQVRTRPAQLPIQDRENSPLPAASEAPRGQEAIRLVLEDYRGRWFTVTGMVEELRARGWVTSDSKPGPAVRVALERLAAQPGSKIKKDKGKKTGAVTYCLASEAPMT